MIGADRWIYKNDYTLFSRRWFRYWPTYVKRMGRHVWQRLRRGYSCYDMWNAHTFLGDLIAQSVYWHFSHSLYAIAGVDREGWLDDLLVIRDGFTPNDDFGWRPTDEAWALLKEHFCGLWD